MTQHDQKILFTALAFMAFVTKEGDSHETGNSQSILKLAGLVEEYCACHVSSTIRKLELVDDAGAAELDQRIERHIQELRQKQETQLPEDKETLLNFYDRLQLRKSRRMQSEFYMLATAERLADIVLGYLDEEISGMENMI